MAYPVELASVLSGATIAQLYYWRSERSGALLVPEIAQRPRFLYSFRDVVALRTMAKLRSENYSLQSIRRAFESLRDNDLTEHPASYHLRGYGKSIVLVEEGNEHTGYEPRALDLVRSPGNYHLIGSLEEIFTEFTDIHGENVVNFKHPRPRLEVREQRISGWPTIRGTRVPFDAVSDLLGTGEVDAADVGDFYPTVTPEDAMDAVDLAEQVENVRSTA